MLDCEIYGLNPLGHHITNLLIHIAASLLLFLLLSKMTVAIWPSAFVAAVFALHPVHVESVAWLAERKDVLSGLFWMLTMLAYIRYAERPNFKRYVLVLLAFVMGLMAKPMVVTLPLVLVLLDWWPLDRLARFRNNAAAAAKKRQKPSVSYPKTTFRHLVGEKVPLFGMSALSCVMTLIAQRSGEVVIALEKVTLEHRVANMFVSYISYIGKTIWPSRLTVFYPHPRINFSDPIVVIYTLLFVMVSAISIYIGRRRKYAVVGWLWYVGTLVPVIGLVQVGVQAMANRYMYIPMVGLLIIVAWAVKDLVDNRPGLRVITAVLALSSLVAAVVVTQTQVGYWRNNLTLFGYALKVTENNDLAESNYALALVDEGRLDEAESHLRQAVRINPACFDDRINLGVIFLRQGKLNEAIACLNEVVRDKPDSAQAYYLLAAAYGMEKKYDDAIKSITRNLKLDPNYPDARKIMGSLLLATGKLNEAIPYFNEALRTGANQVEIYKSLGSVYNQLGKYEQAIQNWKKALELEPDNAEVLNNLAWVLATTGDISVQNGVKAVEFAQRTCELIGYKEPALLDTLAAAYAAAGRLDDAVTAAQRAVNIAKARGQDELAGEIQKRMELYKAGQPYRRK
jgi:tetratricopeptide (TPR) repeat protein